MRLVCPNCDAEYEVDAAAIPDGGRDVQCSNCGHAWFQLSPSVEAELAAEEALFDAPPPIDSPARPDETAKAEPGQMEGDEPAFDPQPGEAAHPNKPAAPAPVLRSIDESVLAVLREEAAREVEARKGEAPVVETQTELGLEAGAGAGAVSRRLARMKGEPEVAAKPQTRGEMLPEIEEINSTLRASSERRAGQSAAISQTLAEANAPRSSFRSGFVLMLLLGVIFLATYVMAPKLAQQFPAASGALQEYIAVVDAARLWVDGLLRAAIGFLKGLAGTKP